ncbi:MAG: T9SS type A sorting domain-containing protein, partial [Ignavibacteria bacterium]|nr:T9SS type A sorting domain-containing protein [Ignavibacteria bacterium]
LTDTLFVSLLPNSQTNISLLTANAGQDSLSVIFYPEQPENWLSITGNEFKIAGNESVEVPILINSSGLSNGNYLAAIIADAGIFGLKRIVIQLIVGDPVGILGAENEQLAVTVFPNPFKNSLQFELTSFRKDESIHLQIFDSRGLILFETTREAINKPYVMQWNGDKYPKGMYFYKLQSTRSVLSGRLLKF